MESVSDGEPAPSKSARIARYGEWASPITSAAFTASSVGLSSFSFAGDAAYWLEARPADGGRVALVKASLDGAGAPVDVTRTAAPAGAENGVVWNVRSRAHEYGGGSYVVDPTSGTAYFSNFTDQCVHAVEVDGIMGYGIPRAITEADKGYVFADFVFEPRGRRLFCVRETHFCPGTLDKSETSSSLREPRSEIVAIDVDTGCMHVLATGRDFYAAPRLSSDARTLAFMAWDHPSMPWDSTGIYVGELDDASSDNTGGVKIAGDLHCVAGGLPYGDSASVSVMEPKFGPNDDLYYISDVTGWWGIHMSSRKGRGESKHLFGRSGVEVGGPMWVFGGHSYDFVLDRSGMQRMFVGYRGIEEPGTKVAVLDLTTGVCQDFKTQYQTLESVRMISLQSEPGVAMFGCIAGSSKQISRCVVVPVDLKTCSSVRSWTELRLASKLIVDESVTSDPRVIEFPTTGGRTAFMLYYAPKNDSFAAPDGELPPLLVKSHGGPTARARTTYNAGWQYFTSRGFAVADVDYGGSTGYGKEYRNRLKGQWGVVDVDDCCNAALYLADIGFVDRNRLTISGGSAGGFTTLACLSFRPDVFSAGASYYGVADLKLLAAETHKFESRYLDSLVGPFPAARDVYDARSPVFSADRVRCPLVQFQGLEDRVVPPSQARVMFDALQKNGVPTALVEFPGEQHGFRAAAAIRRSLDGELWFYGCVLGFSPVLGSDDFEKFDIVRKQSVHEK